MSLMPVRSSGYGGICGGLIKQAQNRASVNHQLCIIASRFRVSICGSRPNGGSAHPRRGGISMLRWALGFFIVALVAALLGFTGVAVAAAGIAKILFYLFLILFLVTLVGHLLRRT